MALYVQKLNPDGTPFGEKRPLRDSGPERPLPGSAGVEAVAEALGLEREPTTMFPVPKVDLR